MAVTMDPKPERLRENVILKFKNLKVTWILDVISCFDLFWQDKIRFQVLTVSGEALYVLKWPQQKVKKLQYVIVLYCIYSFLI